MVEQLTECLKLNRDRVDLPSHLWMNDLINAYVRILRFLEHDTKLFSLAAINDIHSSAQYEVKRNCFQPLAIQELSNK